jgi:hypothetical protein
MSFGAMAGWQALLLFAAVGAAAAGLFLIRMRPPRISVPSLVLWQRVLDEARETTWWERIRRAVSLAATVLVAIALTAALTRPGPAVAAAAHGRMLIVLDSSWSMLARTASGATRWRLASAQAHALAASAAGNEVALATTADGLVEGPTSDLALIDGAIDDLSPSGGENGDWPRMPGDASVHFFTDGAVPRSLDPSVVVHSVFESAPNVAITAFGVRPALTPGAPGEAYLEIANFATTPQEVKLVVVRGSTTVQDAPVPLAAGEVARTTVPVPAAGDAQLRARVSAPANALAIDDEAVAWVPGADALSVVVVSDQPAPLQQLLGRAPGVRATFVTPAAYKPGAGDVLVFDRVVPAEAPSRPALFIAPPAAAWLGAPGAEERQPSWTRTTAHPVLAGVDPLTLDVKKARAYDGDRLQTIASSVRGTPLVRVADEMDRRYVILTFGFAESNLAFAPAFPVLFGNALDWLGGQASGLSRQPSRVFLPASTNAVAAADGHKVPIVRLGDRVVATLDRPGFYAVDSGGSTQTIAVNVGDAQVSNLTRTSLPPSIANAVPAGGGSRPWWLYALVVAFVLLNVEWWTWQRRITV